MGKYFKNGSFDWTILSEELYEWANDLTDFTEWDWVNEDRKAQLSESALEEVEAVLAEIKGKKVVELLCGDTAMYDESEVVSKVWEDTEEEQARVMTSDGYMIGWFDGQNSWGRV